MDTVAANQRAPQWRQQAYGAVKRSHNLQVITAAKFSPPPPTRTSFFSDINNAHLSRALQRAPSGQGKSRVDLLLRRGQRKYKCGQITNLEQYILAKNIISVFVNPTVYVRWDVLAANRGSLFAVVVNLLICFLFFCTSGLLDLL